MKDEEALRQSQDTRGAGPPTGPPPSIPDINAETYPFDVVSYLLDQGAYFNMLSIPDPKHTNIAIYAPGQSGVLTGIRLNKLLHRFSIEMQLPSKERGVKAVNTMGEVIGRFEQRWMIIPDDFEAIPGREPPPTALDTSRSQRFVMLDGNCTFVNGKDGFQGFGTGRTFPFVVNGERKLLAASVGNVMEGRGSFREKEGTYTYCGSLSPERGFTGNMMLRVIDPEGNLHAERSLPDIQPIPSPEPDVTYLAFRGQKKDRTQRTNYIIGPDGMPEGIKLDPQIRLFNFEAAIDARGNLRSVYSVGQVIGRLKGDIFFNPIDPGAPGTATAPIPFIDYDTYYFSDANGREVGSFDFDGGAGRLLGGPYATNSGEGRTFQLTLPALPGQRALRFGGFGPILNGTGVFAGIEGIVIHNSVVGIAPHAVSTLFIARINDPEGKYRAALKNSRH